MVTREDILMIAIVCVDLNEEEGVCWRLQRVATASPTPNKDLGSCKQIEEE